jgi:hypothetical protein
LLGGAIIEYDENGNPIETDTPRFGVRIFDETGRPRIAFLTGTETAPSTPAMLLGAQDDINYLWYTDGRLRLKGAGWIDEGQIGGFDLSALRLKSLNNRVVLVNEADLTLAEGLLLITGTREDAGVIAWRRSESVSDETRYSGIIANFREADEAGILQQRMLLGVSNQHATIGQNPESTFRIECSTPYGTTGKTYLQLQHRANLLQSNARLQVKQIEPLVIDGAEQPLIVKGLRGSFWVGVGDFCFITTGASAAGSVDVQGKGVYCNSSNASMLFGLKVPGHLQGIPIKITAFAIEYKTNTTAAHIYNIAVYLVDAAGPVAIWQYTDNLGQGVTGVEYRQLLEDSVILIGTNYPAMIRVDISGAVANGDIIIGGFNVEWEQDYNP